MENSESKFVLRVTLFFFLKGGMMAILIAVEIISCIMANYLLSGSALQSDEGSVQFFYHVQKRKVNNWSVSRWP